MTQELIKALTIDDVKKAFPSRRNAITQEIVDIFNHSITEPEFQGVDLIQSAVTYESVLKGVAGVGMKDYINALRFCAYLVTVDDNFTEAYKRTFYNRDFVRERYNVATASVEYRELTAAASRYRRSKLVVDILTISQTPLDLLFTGARHKALGVLADRMINAKLDKDKIAAAKELLAATNGPEKNKLTLEVGTQENSAVQSLMEQLTAVAKTQKALLETGAKTVYELGAIRPADTVQADADEF